MYKCDFCSYISDRKYNVSLHMNVKHRSNLQDNKCNIENPNKCVKCNKTFSTKQSLNKHSLICKGIINPLECHKCNKIFSCSSNKSRHLHICKAEMKSDIVLLEEKPSQIIINNDNSQNITINNNIVINAVIFQESPDKISGFVDNYTMGYIANDIIMPFYKNPPLMLENYYRHLCKDENNRYIKKSNCKSNYCMVKTEDGSWIRKNDNVVIPKLTHDLVHNFLDVINEEDNEKEMCNINKRLKKERILPNMRDYMDNLLHINKDLYTQDDTDKINIKRFNIVKDKLLCVILDTFNKYIKQFE